MQNCPRNLQLITTTFHVQPEKRTHSHKKFKIRVDSCSSIVMGTKPRFEPLDFVDVESPADQGRYSSLAIRYKAKLFNLTNLRDLSEETIGIYWDLRNLSALKEVASCHPDRNVEMISYGIMLEQLERRVVQMVQREDLLSPTTDLINIYRLFGYAAIIHIYMFMRDLLRGLGSFHLLSTRVRKSLECVDIRILYIQHPEMMLWIPIMGDWVVLACQTEAGLRISWLKCVRCQDYTAGMRSLLRLQNSSGLSYIVVQSQWDSGMMSLWHKASNKATKLDG